MLAATPLQRGVYAGRYDEWKPLALRQAVAGCRRLWILLAAVLASSGCRVCLFPHQESGDDRRGRRV